MKNSFRKLVQDKAGYVVDFFHNKQYWAFEVIYNILHYLDESNKCVGPIREFKNFGF
jgi:hypothetical protein